MWLWLAWKFLSSSLLLFFSPICLMLFSLQPVHTMAPSGGVSGFDIRELKVLWDQGHRASQAGGWVREAEWMRNKHGGRRRWSWGERQRLFKAMPCCETRSREQQGWTISKLHPEYFGFSVCCTIDDCPSKDKQKFSWTTEKPQTCLFFYSAGWKQQTVAFNVWKRCLTSFISWMKIKSERWDYLFMTHGAH